MQGLTDDFASAQDRESRGPDHSKADQAFAQGDPQRVGWFKFFFDDDRWEWSPEVDRIHGYQPGTVAPTTALVLSHKHPDDYRQIAETVEMIRKTRAAFSSRHRIIDTAGRVRHVVLVGDEMRDETGEVIGTQGFYIDATPAEHARQDQLTAELADVADKRAAIEQAKGMLMMVYQLDAEAAFDLLRWRSQSANVKLRRLAQQIVVDFAGLEHDGQMPPRASYDGLLLTAHLRLDAGSGSDNRAAPD